LGELHENSAATPEGCRATRVASILEGDEHVSARDIFDGNDARHKINWSKVTKKSIRDLIAQTPEVLEFTAQTPMASSYGVMQTMWLTAADNKEYGFYDVDDVPRPPNDLVDAQASLQDGFSSLTVGALLLKRHATAVFGQQPAELTNEDLFLESFRRVLKKYNTMPVYPDLVFDHLNSMAPHSAVHVFN
jgi:hypothetical protein